MLVKTEEGNYIRDTNSMALLNTDRSAREEYFMKAKMMQLQKSEITRINSEIDSLKSDIGDIKSMLIQLLSDKTNGK
jgi:hypothetical protein